MVQPDRPQMAKWCVHIACWITKATETHSEYVLLIALREKIITASTLVLGL